MVSTAHKPSTQHVWRDSSQSSCRGAKGLAEESSPRMPSLLCPFSWKSIKVYHVGIKYKADLCVEGLVWFWIECYQSLFSPNLKTFNLFNLCQVNWKNCFLFSRCFTGNAISKASIIIIRVFICIEVFMMYEFILKGFEDQHKIEFYDVKVNASLRWKAI